MRRETLAGKKHASIIGGMLVFIIFLPFFLISYNFQCLPDLVPH
jgi:hypothetical protein